MSKSNQSLSKKKYAMVAVLAIVTLVSLACSLLSGSGSSITPPTQPTKTGPESEINASPQAPAQAGQGLAGAATLQAPAQAGSGAVSVASPQATAQTGMGVSDTDCNQYFGKIIFSKQFVDQTPPVNELVFTNPDGSNPIRIQENDPDVHYYADPAWSPNHCRIAFTGRNYDTGNNADIYTMDPDGTDILRLTDDPAQDNQPDWSPDGQRIVFVSYRDGASLWHLYVMNADGSNQRLLTDAFEMLTDPEWSPDGKKILFECNDYRNNQGYDQVCTIDSDGKNLKILTPTDDSHVHYKYPTWSPDGSQIALVTNVFDARINQIGIMEADGSNLQVLPFQDEYIEPMYPKWSPDGTKIVVVDFADPQGTFADLFTIDVKSRAMLFLMHTKQEENRPDW
jgi:TolB protein